LAARPEAILFIGEIPVLDFIQTGMTAYYLAGFGFFGFHLIFGFGH
jgi:hypothetical protein